MANKNNPQNLGAYRIKIPTDQTDKEGAIISKEVQLVDGNQSPFISYDELIRCFSSIFLNPADQQDLEKTAITSLIASEDDITAIIK